MGFTAKQNEALSARLNRDNVAQRQQGGGKVSYIEGWHAIAEANRIFGFDGWTRETFELRQLGNPRDVDGKCRVEYLARVRVTVFTADSPFPIVREGCGFGQGIDRDVGQAHESALKEAETDAMKRALMTFGNPFGLALYDKSQSNVASLPPPVIDDGQHSVLETLLEQTGVDAKVFFAHYGATSLRDFPAAKYEHARRNLSAKLKEAA